MSSRTALRFGVLLFIGVCAFGLAVYLWPTSQHGPRGAESPVVTERPGYADVSIGGMRLVEMDADRKEWELEAVSADAYEGRGVTYLKEVHIVFYPDEPEPIDVRGERATFFTTTRDFQIEGNVVVTPIEGYTAYTDSVRWVADEQVITTDDEVRAVKPGSELRGKGMRADARTRRLEIFQSVEAHFD